ncbi:MAG: PD-(D/E)XK nuclease family protein, partial [Prevotella sp.]|nr:PD-(D/E)XK nuclease family protein [Prevotella sp.]
ETKTLKVNYRSERHVIDFNNAFFQIAARIDYEEQNELFPEGARQLQKAYQPDEVVQEIPTKRGPHGYVGIELIPKDDYQAVMISKVSDAVLRLLASGISERKIAILVRSNQTIREIADFFMQNHPDIRLVSDEAFSLDSSLAVNMIINAMRVLTHPEDQLAQANIAKAYQKQIMRQAYIEGEQIIRGADVRKLLPPAFIDHLDQLVMLPVSELVEKLCTIFDLTQLSDQSAYIYKLFDVIGDYLQDHSPDLDSFLADWDESLHLKAIQSDEAEGIRLTTIHKSKGLEFDHVIIPYCDWKLEKASTLWCRPSEEPFNELPLVPISFNEKQMMGSIYEHDYLEEHLQNMVDNLNLLYVAFTRASKTLLVFARRGQRGSRSYLIEQALTDVHMSLPGSLLEGDFANSKESIRFTYGSMAPIAAKAQATSMNVISSQPTPISVNIENFEKPVEFRQSNKSREFVGGTDDAEQQNYIQTGKVLHHILSTIRTESDIETAICQLEFDGILHYDGIDQTKIRAMLQKRLADPRVKEWFAPKWRLFNECAILHIDPDTQQVVEHRPDRVMSDGQEWIVVDYKFGQPRSEYHDQVARYMHLLTRMGHQHVRGYLWFVYANRIEEVKT